MAPKNKHDLMAAMLDHCGKEKGISSRALAVKVGVKERTIRTLITESRLDGFAVCGHPKSGYFVASSPAELEETVSFLKHRALTSLQLASTLSNRPLGDLIGQLHINA